MKKLILVSIIVASAFAANAQQQCTTYANGQVICTPVGGGQSSYR